MKSILKRLLNLSLVAGAIGLGSSGATPVAFTGTYTQNFDQVLTNSATAMPAGFRSLVISGANSTYTAANPISTTAIAAATAGTQTLIVWNSGSAVTDSGTSLYNIGTFGNLTDRAIGSDPTGVGAMVIELSLSNATGSALSGVNLGYSCKCLTNGSAGTEASELPGYSFFYSLTGSNVASGWTKVAALANGNYTQGTTSNTGPVTITFASPLTNGGVMYFRWADDNNQSSSPDQMLAIDNISVSGISASGPVVNITSPANGSSFLPGTNLSITATASDSAATVTNVSFYSNATNNLGSVTNSPYTITLTNLAIGSYSLTAVAADSGGLLATSSVVAVTVAHTAPTVSLTGPASGAAYGSPASIALTATAAGTDGTVTNVAFYQGSTFLGSVPSSPYLYTWAGVSAGSYTLYAVATDNNGLNTTSATVAITVTNSSVTVFTGSYSENFDSDLTNSTTVMPTGFTALYLPGSHLTYTNGIPIDTNAIVTAIPGTGGTTLVLWNAGSAVNKATYQLFNVGCWDSLNDRALGTDPTGTAGTVIQLAMTNLSGSSLSSIVFSYTERCLTNGSTSNGSYTDDGTERLELPGYSFFYSTVGDTNASNWFYVQALSLTNWVQGTDSNSGPVTITFPTPLTNGGVMYFRWADDNCVASSPDQMFAIDDITVSNAIPPTNYFYPTYYLGNGFFSGFNIATTNSGGLNLYIWSSTNPVAPVSTWTLEGLMQEQPLHDTNNDSRYSFNLNPVVSPTYYITAQTNVGPFAPTAPVEWVTTPDFQNYNFSMNTYAIDTNGVLQIPGPVVSITTPTNGQNFIPGTAIAISVDATDSVTNLTSVSLYAGGSLIYTFASAPYYLPIPGGSIPPGSYALTAVANDANGLSVTSPVVNITVAYAAPTISLTSPVSGSSYESPASIPLTASAASSDGTVTNVAFYQGTNLLANVTNSPFSYTWNNVAAGSYSLTALATDSHGLTATSSIVSVAVTNGFGVPQVVITSPTNGATFLPGSSISLAASASELGGTITNVEFFANSTDLGGATSSPYGIVWPSVGAGNYAVTAVASDASGINATSSVVNITVSSVHQPPAVSITSPTNNSAINVAGGLTVITSASATGATVTNVAFYLNSLLVTNITSAPFTFTWSNNPPTGIYTLSAVATDSTGSSTTSATVNVTATNSFSLATLRQIKTIFIIPLENHDFVQANPTGSPQQLLNNPACPYFNSLITPGNSNAVQTAYATHYYSSAINGEHPSEPNYVWMEAGTDFGVRTDNDPSTSSGNLFSNVTHLSAQLTAAGIAWHNYQEDVQYSSSPTVSASGSSGAVNAFNGTTDYNYAVKHNPMAFFTDTQNVNVYPLTNLWSDLTNGNVGRYNWVTPDQYNEMHSSLPSGYTYHGVAYTGDQAAIAEGDNFLSIAIPRIMATQAYQDHGAIIIWTDETESTDDTGTTLPYVIISPLAKGNAYASTLPYSHSSDLKTMDELFGLAYQSNAIPSAELDAQNTAYNKVNGSSAVIYDLSDFFTPVYTAPVLLGSQAKFVTNGFQIAFSGPVGQTYKVLSSSVATAPESTWTVVTSGTFSSTNTVVFTDTTASRTGGRYYVVKSP